MALLDKKQQQIRTSMVQLVVEANAGSNLECFAATYGAQTVIRICKGHKLLATRFELSLDATADMFE